MTVRYSREVGTSTFFSSYRLLFKWKGSIWKSVLIELALWSAIYFFLKIAYTYWLTGAQRDVFEDICVFCNNYSNFLPITFMLGFYVQAVFGRWQKIFNNIGWIDTSALALSTHVKGTTEYARNIRRNIIRYLSLTQALVFRDISSPVKKRLPTIQHLITSGFMSQEELVTYDSLVTPNTKYYWPIQWALALLSEARENGLVTSDMAMVDVTQKIYQWREQVVSLTFFDWVQVPLAYTQVVNLAVSSFFIAALMGRQFLHPTREIPGHTQPVDPIVPFMSMLQFIFLVGWTKVAEIMLNPMGEDDDDFETNWLLDRNLQVGLALADSHYGVHPPLRKDKFWSEPIAEPLYTPESASLHRNPQIGSCADISTDENSNIMVRLQGRKPSLPAAPAKNSQEYVLPFHLRTPSMKISDSSLPAVLDTLPENSTTVQTLSERSVDDGGQISQDEEEEPAPRNDRMEISKRMLFWKSLILLIPLAASPLLLFGKESRCIFVIVVMSLYWLTDIIPMGVTALLPLLLFPFFGILGAKDVSMDYFKEQIVLFMTSLIMAMAVEVTNLHKRIALSMLRIVGSNRHSILLGQMVATAFVSFFVSDTAATTLMLPIVLAILSTLEEIKKKPEDSQSSDSSLTAKDTARTSRDTVQTSRDAVQTAKKPTGKEENSRSTAGNDSSQTEKKLVCGLDIKGMSKKDRSFCKAMVLATSQASLIGGTGIITGTGTNLVFREQVPYVYPSIEVGYVEWMSFSLPFVPIYLVASWICLNVILMPKELIPRRFREELTPQEKEEEKEKTCRMKEKIKEAHRNLGGMSFEEASVMIWFILLLLAWCTRDPGFVRGWDALLPKNSKGKTQSTWLVKDSTVAVFVAMLMFIWPRSLSDPKLEPILTWEHMKTKYSWSCTLLIGSGFALSHGVQKSGLGDLLACQMHDVFVHMHKFWLQFLAALTVCFATEFASNVATAGIFIPIMLSLSKGLGLHPLYLVIPVTISCSFAFMFPQATPGNAIVVDTKIVSFFEMMSVGFFLNIICVWLTVLNCNTYAYWMLQLGHIPESVKAVNNQLNCGGNVTVG